MTVQLEISVRTNSDFERRERRISVFHEDVKVVVGPLEKNGAKRLFVKIRELVEWK